MLTFFTGSSALTIHRGCTPIAYCEVQTPKSDHCSVCTNDLCNSSSITIPSVVMCFSALLAGFVWKFWREYVLSYKIYLMFV